MLQTCSRAVFTGMCFLTCPNRIITLSSAYFDNLCVPVMVCTTLRYNCVYVTLPLLDMKDLERRGCMSFSWFVLFCPIWCIVSALFLLVQCNQLALSPPWKAGEKQEWEWERGRTGKLERGGHVWMQGEGAGDDSEVPNSVIWVKVH